MEARGGRGFPGGVLRLERVKIGPLLDVVSVEGLLPGGTLPEAHYFLCPLVPAPFAHPHVYAYALGGRERPFE